MTQGLFILEEKEEKTAPVSESTHAEMYVSYRYDLRRDQVR